MRKISASFIFPVSSPPIKRGVVVIDADGKILEVQNTLEHEVEGVEYYDGIIIPGIVNTFCDKSRIKLIEDIETSRRFAHQQYHSGSVLMGTDYDKFAWHDDVADQHVTITPVNYWISESSQFVDNEQFHKTLPTVLEIALKDNCWESALNQLLQLPNDTNLIIHSSNKIPVEIIATAIKHFPNCHFTIYPDDSMESIISITGLVHKLAIGSGQNSLGELPKLFRSIQQYNIDTPLEEMFRWATLNGAKALKMEQTFGSLEKGKKPGILLLTGINMQLFKLTEEAKLQRLI